MAVSEDICKFKFNKNQLKGDILEHCFIRQSCFFLTCLKMFLIGMFRSKETTNPNL